MQLGKESTLHVSFMVECFECYFFVHFKSYVSDTSSKYAVSEQL